MTFVAVSRAPLPEIEAFKKRMGWRFKWVSSYGSDFNYDFHVSFTKDDLAKGKVFYNYELHDFQSEEMSGGSVFYKDGNGDIFHTYSSYARGGGHVSRHLCLPRSHAEGPRRDWSQPRLTDWVRHHDRYGDGGFVDPTGRYVAPKEPGSCHSLGEDHS